MSWIPEEAMTACFCCWFRSSVRVPAGFVGRSSEWFTLWVTPYFVLLFPARATLHLYTSLGNSAFLCLPGPNENSFSVSKYIEELFFNAMEVGHHTLMDFFPIWCLMKTIIFHCNGSWKYTVLSQGKSSEISVFCWDPGSTRMPSFW